MAFPQKLLSGVRQGELVGHAGIPYNSLVVGSSPTRSTTQSPCNRTIPAGVAHDAGPRTPSGPANVGGTDSFTAGVCRPCPLNKRDILGLLGVQPNSMLRQGNRVKKSCGDETCEKFVVPCGNFSLKAQAVFARGLSDQVEGHVFYGGEVGRGVIGSDAAFVIAKDHVHYPM